MADRSVRVRDYNSAVAEWLIEATTPLKEKIEEGSEELRQEAPLYADDDEEIGGMDADTNTVSEANDMQEGIND